jgi:hypothetical protein
MSTMTKNGMALLAVGLAGLLATGCSVRTNELTGVEAAGLRDKTLLLVRYDDVPNFMASTAGRMGIALVGVPAAFAAGNQMIRSNNISDPAEEISRQLAAGLREIHQLQVVEAEQRIPRSTRPKALPTVYAGHDYILDVRTELWGADYFATDWTNYRVSYWAAIRLLDGKTGKLLASDRCLHMPKYADTNMAPRYEDLQRGDGLRSTLAESVKYCVEQARSKAKFGAVGAALPAAAPSEG